MKIAMYVYIGALVGAMLAGFNISVLEKPLLFFAIDIPLVLLGIFITNKIKPDK